MAKNVKGRILLHLKTLLFEYFILYLSDFSRADWIAEEALQPGEPLPNYVTAKLKEILEISPYMKKKSCKKDLPPYGPSYDGWMKG